MLQKLREARKVKKKKKDSREHLHYSLSAFELYQNLSQEFSGFLNPCPMYPSSHRGVLFLHSVALHLCFPVYSDLSGYPRLSDP